MDMPPKIEEKEGQSRDGILISMHASLSDQHETLSDARPVRPTPFMVEIVKAEQEITRLKQKAQEADLRLLRLSAENLRLGDALDQALRGKDAAAERMSRLEQLLLNTDRQYLNASSEIKKALDAKQQAEVKSDLLESSIRSLEAEHRAVLMSRCWRSTAPVRAIIAFIRRG